MTDAQIKEWMANARAAYRIGTLSKWKIKQLESRSGWKWE